MASSLTTISALSSEATKGLGDISVQLERIADHLKPMVEIRVYGIPRPQGSKRHVGRGIMVESSRHVGQWRNDVMSAAATAHRGAPITGPVKA